MVVAFGLRIRSAIAIPGAMVDPDEQPPDIDIRFGAGDIGPERAAEGPYRVGPHGFEFAMPGVARYVCVGNRVLVAPEPGANEADIAAMLIATVLPALLWARGEIVLHAAAFADPRRARAVAIAGASGTGKSTLLAQAVAAGACVIADDSLCLRASVASGLPGGWYDPLVAGETERRFNPVPAAAQLGEHPLGHILILTPGLDAPRALHGADAVKALLDNRHRPRIARLMGHEAALLPKIGAICGSIPIFAVPSRSDDIVSSWRDIFDIGNEL